MAGTFVLKKMGHQYTFNLEGGTGQVIGHQRAVHQQGSRREQHQIGEDERARRHDERRDPGVHLVIAS
jgi:hypothetical protein